MRLSATPLMQAAQMATKAQSVQTQPKLRSDFSLALEQSMTAKIGLGSKKNSMLEKAFTPFLEEGKFDLDKLPSPVKRELVKLQKASEDFEAYFLKDLLSKMRPVSLSGEKSPMADMAKDMMDQAISESAAKGNGSLGIAKTVFLSMSERLVNQAAGEAAEKSKLNQ